ncbi:MAG: S-layer homology domain-containing protein [Defluviitaleaceae bacterium]|nr:S-layer homology domain-containing protein [Defluviitaleaceae bacterium]
MIKRILKATLVSAVLCATFAFTAVASPSSWALEQVELAIEAGLVPEILQSNYQQPITRAEFAALAVALNEAITGEEITGRMLFNDTNDVNVQKAGYLGVVSGVGNDNFAPDNLLTREQAAVILARLYATVSWELLPSEPTFDDNYAISSWAYSYVGAVQTGLIMGGVGDNRFDPAGLYTREASIITIWRVFYLAITPYIHGVATAEDGRILDGFFDRETGYFIRGVVLHPNGMIEEGIFSPSVRLLEGLMLIPDVALLAGTFNPETGLLVEGSILFDDGTIYQGIFDNEGMALIEGTITIDGVTIQYPMPFDMSIFRDLLIQVMWMETVVFVTEEGRPIIDSRERNLNNITEMIYGIEAFEDLLAMTELAREFLGGEHEEEFYSVLTLMVLEIDRVADLFIQ